MDNTLNMFIEKVDDAIVKNSNKVSGIDVWSIVEFVKKLVTDPEIVELAKKIVEQGIFSADKKLYFFLAVEIINVIKDQLPDAEVQ